MQIDVAQILMCPREIGIQLERATVLMNGGARREPTRDAGQQDAPSEVRFCKVRVESQRPLRGQPGPGHRGRIPRGKLVGAHAVRPRKIRLRRRKVRIPRNRLLEPCDRHRIIFPILTPQPQFGVEIRVVGRAILCP